MKKLIRWNIDLVQEFVLENGNGTILLSNQYLTNKDLLSFKCKCGQEFETTFKRFKDRNKRKCNTCSGFKRLTLEEARKIFIDSGLKPLFYEYEGAARKHLAMTPEGYKVHINIDKLKSGKYPDAFSKFNPYSIENIKKYLKNEGEGYEIVSTEYQNNYTKMGWICPEGHEFKMPWGEFGQNKRCPKCKASKGERKITNYLVKNEIMFLREVSFVDLLGEKGNKLRFDFAIIDYKENIKLLIEYDGLQHFDKRGFYGENREEKYKKLQKNDGKKNNYCKENGIPLLRIPYTMYENIGEILDTHL